MRRQPDLMPITFSGMFPCCADDSKPSSMRMHARLGDALCVHDEAHRDFSRARIDSRQPRLSRQRLSGIETGFAGHSPCGRMRPTPRLRRHVPGGPPSSLDDGSNRWGGPSGELDRLWSSTAGLPRSATSASPSFARLLRCDHFRNRCSRFRGQPHRVDPRDERG